jgi:hypothetical protein
VLCARDLRRNGGLATNGDQDLLGIDDHFGAIIEGDLGLVLRQEATPAVEVLDLVVVEIALVDAVKALDICITLGLECGPVEGGGLLDGEAVSFRVVDGLGEGRSVEGDLLRNTTEAQQS